MTAQIHTDQPIPETPVLRGLSDLLCLYGLCGRRACRRARSCRGEPQQCLARYAPLVPEDARDGAKHVIAGKRLGLSFDELMEEARAEVLALSAWANAIAAGCRAAPPRR